LWDLLIVFGCMEADDLALNIDQRGSHAAGSDIDRQ
jgi:hypothetical protein